VSTKIIFIGTPKFGAIILEGLCKSEYKPYSGRRPSGPFRPILVITAPDKPVGREQILTPPPVKLLAQKYEIPVAQPEKILNLKPEILNFKPNLIVVAAYGQILPKEILEIPKYSCLNIHPSLLPRWRGASPIQYAILNGDKETGVTIILMNEKMDEGDILSNEKLKIGNKKIIYTDLENKLANLGVKLLIETIPKWLNDKIKPKSQDSSKATYTKILTKEDGKIDWQKSAEEIERKVRAFNVWPGTFTFWQKDDKLLRIKILKARVYKFPQEFVYLIGRTLVVPQNEIAVQCRRDYLVIEELQLEGKKEMKPEEFLRGHQDFIGTILK